MFHENQLTFPWSPEDPDPQSGRDLGYAYINVSSCPWPATQVWFNSEHHRDVFLKAVEYVDVHAQAQTRMSARRGLRRQIRVMHLGLEFDRVGNASNPRRHLNGPVPDVPGGSLEPTMVMGQRHRRFRQFVHGILEQNWTPNLWCSANPLSATRRLGCDIQEAMGNRCLQWGFVESKRIHVQWLWRAMSPQFAASRIFWVGRGGSHALWRHAMGARTCLHRNHAPRHHHAP